MKIAVDAMGGDFAPEAIVEGIARTVKAGLPDGVTLVLIGQESVINTLLTQFGVTSGGEVEVIHADEVIDMGEHPTRALSQKPNSSIAVGFAQLKAGQIDAFCSAGNTGAMHVGALFSIKAIPGVIRPGIAGFVPQLNGGTAVMLDIGANADCKPEVLAQFGELGSIYARQTLGIESPRVALLNIGEEEQKGSVVAQAAHQLLKENKRLNFVGNIEGKDLFMNRADVIVADGFTGNTLFKLGESFYEVTKQLGLHHPFIDRTNYESIGGSPIVGVNGNVIIAHGISSPTAIQNMISLAIRQVRASVPAHIEQALT
ncbi:phosphate acyltransferase PlsX [Fibrella sp. HMF5335]|uniref:Phosphate acyltransferase n=1 Tax=Fibrella rubiginis TaxID=2817060 RepID=A0A939K0M8_9BACT|nr:phosphate acyltransferase PlsX [Fibrella rubiginis]MBO0936262.1 phosphate acyltransferase PlsX [Fibrella rubiginis]